MKKIVVFLLILVISLSFSEITIQNLKNNAEVSGIISYKWSENPNVLKNISYWELYCNNNLIAKTTKMHYEWNPESETYPKTDGWYNIVIKGFGNNGKILDEAGLNIYIKHHKLVLRLLERVQTVGNAIRFRIASINIYNGADFPIIDRAQIQLYSRYGGFSLSETNWSTVSSIYIEPGHNESQIIYYRTYKTGYRKIRVSREYWGESSATVYFSPLPVSKSMASSDIYYISGSNSSNRVKIRFEDKYGNTVPLKKDEKIYLYFSDKNGEISTDGKTWNKKFITASKNATSINVYYRNSSTDYGDSVVILTHPGWNNLMINVHIRRRAAILKLVLNRKRADLNEIVYGRIIVLDSEHNETFFSKSTTINVYTTSNKGYFATNDGWYPSLKFTIPAFSFMSQSFYYRDSSVGTQTLTIKSGLSSENCRIGIANTVAKLLCSNCSNSAIAGLPLKFTIQTANKYGTPVIAPTNTKLVLKTSYGEFYKSPKLEKSINTVVFPTGKSSVTVYYYATKAGKDGLAIYEYPDKGWKNIYGEINVSSAQPSKINCSNNATVIVNKYSAPIKFVITDRYGNPDSNSKGYKIKITSDSSTTVFDRSTFKTSSYTGSFRVKESRIGRFKVKLTVSNGNRIIVKHIDFTSLGYLKPATKSVIVTAGNTDKIKVYFTDSNGKKVESMEKIKLDYSSKDKNMNISSKVEKDGYSLSINSTVSGKYRILIKKDEMLLNDSTLKITVVPGSLKNISVFPDKIGKKLSIDNGTLKFSASITDEYGNMVNEYNPYQIHLQSDIGEFLDSKGNTIEDLIFSPKEEKGTFYFKPTKFGTSEILLKDTKTNVEKTIKVSTSAFPYISMPATSTIVKHVPIIIGITNSKGEFVKTINPITVFLKAESGEFRYHEKIVKKAIIDKGESRLTIDFATTKPGTCSLSFEILGKKINKKIYVKDVPILSSFKLSPLSSEIMAGKTISLMLTAYDQHGNRIKVNKEMKFEIEKSKNLKVEVNGKKVENSITFPKNKDSIEIKISSNLAEKSYLKINEGRYGKIYYEFNIVPGKPQRISLTIQKENYLIYKKSLPIKIDFEDSYGNSTSPATRITLSFKSSKHVEFYNIKGKKIDKIMTQSATSFYIMPTKKGSNTIIVSSGRLKPYIFNIYAKSYPYTLKVIGVPPFSKGEISKHIEVYLVDRNNENILAATDTVIKLKTDSKTGEFYNLKKELIDEILIKKGENNSCFCYGDLSLGDHRITLSAQSLKSTSIIVSTVKPVKNIEFRNIDQKYREGGIYKLSVVTVNEDGIQWYIGDGATIKLTSNSTDLLFSTDGKEWSRDLIVKIKPYSSSVNFEIKSLSFGNVTVKALWVERKVDAKITLAFEEGGKE